MENGTANGWDEPRNAEPWSWRVRRWAAPVAMAVTVAASIGAVQVLAGEPRASGTPARAGEEPRFLLSAGRMGHPAQVRGPEPWFEVRAIRQGGVGGPVDSVRPPSPSAGRVRELVAGPGGDFFAVSSREQPCETRLYRFRLTAGGQVTGIEPLPGGVVPSRVAGLAISPDGDRVAYSTAPCDDGARPRAALTVRELGSGDVRTFGTAGPTLIGEIVWAADNRTVGYTIGDVGPDEPSGTSRPGMSGRDIGNVAVHALDSGLRGADLRGGRVLFQQPDGAGDVSGALMDPDGRTGHGVIRKGDPQDIIFFTFAEGEPMRVTQTIPGEPNTWHLIALTSEDRPRYACLGGIDSFGRAANGRFQASPYGVRDCGTAHAY
ncbi:hypothetical protein E1200_15690 [Actinomadura sp. GC306]|uniref:hypothetical protein n=1 Tax=Actinomadura sp. GC306 TaxID=2530367 RepID=UPI0010540568|nr:hypothetical protein [Actinomadura sp. GC306]TDC67032.1 hypothetical protein E1200_15690 [Actinomadura sp. GC306]